MTSSVFDSALFRDMFGTAQMRVDFRVGQRSGGTRRNKKE